MSPRPFEDYCCLLGNASGALRRKLYLHFISKKLEGFFGRAVTIFCRFPSKNVRAIRRNCGGCSMVIARVAWLSKISEIR